MNKLVRVRPCSCGSGRAARDCCGRFRRLPEAEVARAYLHRQARVARELLAPFSPSGLAGLRGELTCLARTHPEFEASLHGPGTPEVGRLVVAASRRNGDTDVFVRAMLGRVDSPMIRVALARAVAALREDGAIDEHLAAAALVDLDGPGSVLLETTLLAAIRAELSAAH